MARARALCRALAAFPRRAVHCAGRRFGRVMGDSGLRGGPKIFEDFCCNPKLLGYYVSVKTKLPSPMRNKKAVPSHLERVTNQWQPARTGGTAQKRVTDELTYIKDRNGRGFLPAQNASQNQVGGAMAGPARISSRKPRCGCANGGRGNRSQSGNADSIGSGHGFGDLLEVD